MKIWKMAPWAKLTLRQNEITITHKGTGSPIGVYVIKEGAPIFELLKQSPDQFMWNEWVKTSPTIENIKWIKACWRFLDQTGTLLNPFSINVWSFNKELPPPIIPDNTKWMGWSEHVSVLRDKIDGWWIEVPGASASLWAPSLLRLQILIDNPTEEEKSLLLQLGFGGHGLRKDVSELTTSTDWLWWESVRFNPRYGEFSRKTGMKLRPLKVPEGKAIGPIGKKPELPLRASVRGHDNRELLTVEDLVDTLSVVFTHTGNFYTDWYGETNRLYGPSGGGVYESEAWVWVRKVEGLLPGLYVFNGEERQLYRQEVSEEIVKIWEQRAENFWGSSFGLPQTVVSIVSDLTRLPQKYERLPLYLALINAGHRMAELTQEAEKRGLAVCGIGGGILKEIPQTFGENSLLMTPTEEIALGGRIKE